MAQLKNKLDDKVAIVTGGASGIGEATARQFALLGARAVVIADVQDHKGHNVAASIGPHCSYIRCDVTDEDQVKSLVDSTVQMHDRLDIMFCNAGVLSLSVQTVLEFDISNYEKVMAVNVRGTAACVKHAARAMVKGGIKGSVVCTASLAATMGLEWITDYAMSKHAVLGLVKSASKQLGAYGIRVNCVSPGAVDTPMLKGFSDFKIVETEMDKVEASKGDRKMVISPDHIADAVVFLASDDSRFVTGHNLVVEGSLH